MEREDDMKLKGETKERMLQIYTDFLTRVAKLDELMAVGGRLLTGFQQGLEFLRRPPINEASKLIENVLKANETKSLKSYLEAGCINNHDRVHNTSKLYTCLHGLHDHWIKVECLLNELECHLRDATATLQMANQQLSPLLDAESSVGLHPHESSSEDEMASSCLREPEVTDYAVLMGIIYSMVKQDCTMQDKIVKSLNLKSTSEELESYSLMWTLRPYINDQTMQLAWKLVP
ncbi:Phosphoenolpyruvate carboxykinase 1 [Hibiscus syriacus]|uniref:Phosphoenolpyruvate carboxykinase 1 n=1 Tax=Hibiscus syriacus TaxID=106335 RepID=A0A6A3A2M1_HIBSY|nr:uncharacterized protein LOC120136198 [Hibiscus syriacus]KAE8697429.1 Phosphoenolpyruvate carboxykinase 1 [Hibiscus syriacus]